MIYEIEVRDTEGLEIGTFDIEIGVAGIRQGTVIEVAGLEFQVYAVLAFNPVAKTATVMGDWA